MFKKVNPKQKFPELEEDILKFWKQEKAFEKSVEGRPASKPFSFYDGPPFATGTPHYGHLLAGTMKDVIPRFKTMQGYRVERVWGWDTHGLPIENIVEQELDFKSKTQIKEYGIDKFNEKCKTKVLEYAEEWEKIVERTGRWVDMKNAYLTMDLSYMESVWWVFKTLWDKKLIYEGHKVMPYCPRCATSLSNFEVGLGYIDKRDKAITVKFELEDEPGTYLLAWTTTPWTLPGNLALAVRKDIDYVEIEIRESNDPLLNNGDKYILANSALDRVFDLLTPITFDALDQDIHITRTTRDKKTVSSTFRLKNKFKGRELVDKRYRSLFNYCKNPKKAFEVVADDFVSTKDGTGIVHIAPAFGEDDYRVAKEQGIDFFMPVDDLGKFSIEVPDYAGKNVVELETNEQIIKDLGKKVLKEEELTHAYPHCWRCDTPLIYRAVTSFFVNVAKNRKKILENNKKIYWMPESIGKGRFHKILQGAPDWNISRQRFWGTPLPVWKCEKCGKAQVFGSVAEFEKACGQKIKDLHLHKIIDIEVSCNCGGKAKLTGDVLDCWFESGSMPYASVHYPFENQEKFKRDFPADFIAEGIDQTRGWFNTLLILSTDLFGKESFRNVIVNGTVLTEDGAKMSKRLANYPDPVDIIHKYGADAMRFYLMMSPAVKAEDLRFSEKGVDEIVKKVTLTFWNSYSFFVTYASLDKFVPKGKLDSKNVLDRWVISKTNELVQNVTDSLEKYDLSTSCRYLLDFMDELSNWYIRRSRKRFWKSENDADKNAAYETLYFVLTTYIKLLAPFMPFVTEEIYQNLVTAVDKKTPTSVHLADWPKPNEKVIDKKLESDMQKAREIIESGLAQRAEYGIKVRQPLAVFKTPSLPSKLKMIVAEEVNVKKVVSANITKPKLDTKMTPELKSEGIARDFVRFIQDSRKKAGFNVEDRIKTGWETQNKEVAAAIKTYSKYIAKETLSIEFKKEKRKYQYSNTVKLDGKEVWLGVTKI